MRVAKFVCKTFFRLMVVMIVLECLLMVCVPANSTDTNQTSISTKSFTSLLYSALLAQAEEEKLEKKSDKAATVELADLSRNISFLSKIHTPHNFFVAEMHADEHPRSLFELFCVFLI